MPTIQFDVSRYEVTDFRPVTLSWFVKEAAEVVLEPFSIPIGARGRLQDYPTQNTTYRLLAKDSAGNTTTSEHHVSVSIPDPVCLYFYAQPSQPFIGDKVVIRWQVIGAERVNLNFGRYRQLKEGVFSFIAWKEQYFELQASRAGYADIERKLCIKPQRKAAPISMRLPDCHFNREVPINDFKSTGIPEISLNVDEVYVDRPDPEIIEVPDKYKHFPFRY